jgi:hypothetical protein
MLLRILLALVLLVSPAFAAQQYSVAVNNARLDAIETAIGTDAVLKIRTGSPPANCAAADSGTVLATVTLPTDWMAAAASGVKAKAGTWQDTSADNTGTAAHYRIYASNGTTCGLQGTYGTSGTDMVGDSVSFTAGQSFTVNTFSITAGNQ